MIDLERHSQTRQGSREVGVTALDATRRLLVIYNPTAGRRRRRLFFHVLRQLRVLGCQIILYETRGPGDAEAFAHEVAPGEYDAVVAAGGDGTIREVVNGLRGRPIPVGIIPLGTANVLANELGIAFDVVSLSKSIALGSAAHVYNGEANGRRFLMMAGIGFDARVVETTSLGLKRATGKVAYVMSSMAALARHRPCSYAVEIDGVSFTAAAVIITKGRYYAGKFVIAEKAQLFEPVLQVVMFAKGRRRDLVKYAIALAAGKLHLTSNVRVVPARAVRVQGREGELIQLDGDLAGKLPLIASVANNPVLLLR